MLTSVGRILSLLGVVWCTTGIIQDVSWAAFLGGLGIGIGSTLLEIGRERELKRIYRR